MKNKHCNYLCRDYCICEKYFNPEVCSLKIDSHKLSTSISQIGSQYALNLWVKKA